MNKQTNDELYDAVLTYIQVTGTEVTEQTCNMVDISKGHDLAEIAGRLGMEVVVLVDLIDEFGED